MSDNSWAHRLGLLAGPSLGELRGLGEEVAALATTVAGAAAASKEGRRLRAACALGALRNPVLRGGDALGAAASATAGLPFMPSIVILQQL